MKVEYDTDGLTDQCPIWGDMNIDDCVGCLHFKSYKEFTVFCEVYVMEKNKKEETK